MIRNGVLGAKATTSPQKPPKKARREHILPTNSTDTERDEHLVSDLVNSYNTGRLSADNPTPKHQHVNKIQALPLRIMEIIYTYLCGTKLNPIANYYRRIIYPVSSRKPADFSEDFKNRSMKSCPTEESSILLAVEELSSLRTRGHGDCSSWHKLWLNSIKATPRAQYYIAILGYTFGSSLEIVCEALAGNELDLAKRIMLRMFLPTSAQWQRSYSVSLFILELINCIHSKAEWDFDTLFRYFGSIAVSVKSIKSSECKNCIKNLAAWREKQEFLAKFCLLCFEKEETREFLSEIGVIRQ